MHCEAVPFAIATLVIAFWRLQTDVAVFPPSARGRAQLRVRCYLAIPLFVLFYILCFSQNHWSFSGRHHMSPSFRVVTTFLCNLSLDANPNRLVVFLS